MGAIVIRDLDQLKDFIDWALDRHIDRIEFSPAAEGLEVASVSMAPSAFIEPAQEAATLRDQDGDEEPDEDGETPDKVLFHSSG